MSFLGSGLAHSAFGGVALGLLLNIEPLYIAVPFTIIVSLSIAWLNSRTKLSADTSVGILFAVSMALGIIFIAMKQEYSADAFNYLFGSILSVMPSDLYIGGIVAIITVLTFFKLWARWAYASFDTELAKADRLNILNDDYMLFICTALTIVVSVKLVGIVLIAAFLVIPAASAKLVSKTFYQMTVIAIVFGIASSILGLYVSFHLDMPSGAIIILIQTFLFLVALLAGKVLKLN
jgi:zinc transport system permease protein